MGYIISGGRRAEFYTGAFSVTPTTVGTTAVYALTEQITTDVAKDDSGIPTVTWEHIQDDSVVEAFLNTYANANTGAAPEDILYEDNTQRLGASSVGTQLLCLVRGGLVVGGADAGKRKSWAGVVAVSKASGSWNQAGGVYAKPTLSATAAPLEYDITLTTTILTSYMVVPGTTVIAAATDKYGKTMYK